MLQDMTEPSDLFDPRHYAGVRKPFHSAQTLPPWCYTSPRFYDREKDTIFKKFWNCLGHESRVPDAGSYDGMLGVVMAGTATVATVEDTPLTSWNIVRCGSPVPLCSASILMKLLWSGPKNAAICW